MLGGKLERGIDLVLDCLRFDERLAGSDLVITSEGLLDRQTLANKGPYGVARAAERAGVPVIILAGGVADDVSGEEFSIFDAIVPICARPMDLGDAMARARERLMAAAEQVGRLLVLGGAIAPRG
jgi:glycerate kinase